jgi:hypothetical protein
VAAAAGALTFIRKTSNQLNVTLSRKENYPMSTMEQEASTNVVSFKHIDKAIKTLKLADMEQENALLGDNLSGRVQKLVKVYSSIKPLLVAVSALPIIPATWRAALVIFTQAVEAVVSSPEIDPDFKAGKDL